MNAIPRKPKVFIAIPVLLVGGTEVQTLNLVRVLLSDDYNVSVCCYYESDESIVVKFKDAGADVILLRLDRSVGRFGFYKMLELIRELVAIFRETRPDIMHVQYLAPGLIPIIAARLSGIRTVFATVHQPGRPYGLMAKLLLRFGAYLSTAFFCVSKSVEKSWFGDSEVLNPQKVNRNRKHFTIYNAVDVSRFTQAAKSTDHDQIRKSLGLNGHPVIGIVGRLRKEKGHSILLDAMTKVIKEVPDTKLLVVGDGPDLTLLETRAETLGIADRIIWLGGREHSEVFQLYSLMDVVALPSLFEGFGLTAAEAMAAGRPVIAQDVDGLNEVVEHSKTGYLVPSGDSNTMAKCLVELLSAPIKAQAMGKAGRKRVKKHFSQERFAEATLDAYLYFSGH